MAKKTRKPKKLKETATTYNAGGSVPAALPAFSGYITTKGQVVIPVALRKKYNITPETKLMIMDDDGRIIIQPIDALAIIESLRGCLADAPVDVVKELLEERARDREREDAEFKFNRVG